MEHWDQKWTKNNQKNFKLFWELQYLKDFKFLSSQIIDESKNNNLNTNAMLMEGSYHELSKTIFCWVFIEILIISSSKKPNALNWDFWATWMHNALIYWR